MTLDLTVVEFEPHVGYKVTNKQRDLGRKKRRKKERKEGGKEGKNTKN